MNEIQAAVNNHNGGLANDQPVVCCIYEVCNRQTEFVMPKFIGSNTQQKPNRPDGIELPLALKPYRFHGLELKYSGGATPEQDKDAGNPQAITDCVFCGKSGKFYIAAKDGQWDCKVCGERGNVYTFIRKLWDVSLAARKIEDSKKLATERGLLDHSTITAWRLAKSVITNEWLIPGYSYDAKLNQLYRYSLDTKTNKHRLLATTGLNHHLHGVNLFDSNKPDVYICEGVWDGMALWEAFKSYKQGPGFELVADEASSFLGRANILARPGANVWNDNWNKLLAGKNVILVGDNDHPKVINHKDVDGAGLAGIKRVVQLLSQCDEPPEYVSFLCWGEGGYDRELKSGYDLRDLLTKDSNTDESTTLVTRGRQLETFFSLIEPIPDSWIVGKAPGTKKGSVEIECTPCEDWKILTTQWKKALKWTPGLDKALSVMLACVVSTKSAGSQLWCKVVGPPSCGKTTLCEALSVNRKYIKAVSTLRGFHSGYRASKDSDEDNSLINMLRDKTLVVKDGDTLLQSPNLGQILSEARDIYDRTSRTHYRNKMSKDYENVNMTWILCGTNSLRSLDNSELGERFIDCVIMDGIDEDLEDEILWKVANKAERTVGMVGAHNDYSAVPTPIDTDELKARQLTGGYVNYLREKADSLIQFITMDDEAKRLCMRLGKFVAYARARPSSKQEETSEREFGARLVEQMVRLTKCLAAVFNKEVVDEQVLSRVTSVVMDTSRGRTLNIIRHLFEAGEDGLETRSIAYLTNHSEDKERQLLRFLYDIKAVTIFQRQLVSNSGPSYANIKGKPRWKLTDRMRDLYKSVCGLREKVV